MEENPIQLLTLPECVIEQIFAYLSYDEMACTRIVCRNFDEILQRLLNRGHLIMMQRYKVNLRKIKAQLPRRESERRNHRLARHADILTCIETRISMLSMTYSKYIERKLCCFIPGRVIDEVLRILNLLENTSSASTTLRANEVLKELRDISSMAIEHFEEKIAPNLKQSFIEHSTQNHHSGHNVSGELNLSDLPSAALVGDPPPLPVEIQPPVPSCHQLCSEQKNHYAVLRMEQKYMDAMKRVTQLIQVQNKHMRQLRHQSYQMSEMKSQLFELRRRFEESFSATKGRELTSPSGGFGEIIAPGSADRPCNIKPRAATIILKRRIAEPTASESKAGKRTKMCN